MDVTIKADNLTKDFGIVKAVDELSFEVGKGQIFGLLGPNGAGKTTTLRMLAGLLKPTSGDAFISGLSMENSTEEARKKLGFLTGDMDLYRRLKPYELLTYFGRLYGVEDAELRERIKNLAAAFGIDEFKNQLCEKLSTGQKQRVSIVRTLVHNPEVVILDEPTTGLDIMSSEFVLQFIKKMAEEEGKTVIFSTHHLDEVERLCDQIAIINQGKLAFNGTMEEAKSSTESTHLADAFFNLVEA